uniref:Phorbol-ester/DAG-type domain-containing protein n=1 Tax=Cucumis sativus TaxID=3659 RepID=A0A0A0KQX2_CUCSA
MSIRPEIVLRNHPSHPWHGLELKNYMKPYTCNGCKEKGFGPRYRCERCDFNLHQACSYTSLRLSSHDYFPGSKFKFLRNPPKPCHPECIIRCDACRKTIKGYVFHCEEDDIDLHPCCRNLKRSYQIEEVKFKLHRKVRGKCMWCNRKNLKDGGNNDNGWSYVSECDNYHLKVQEIQARGRWDGGAKNKFWRITKFIIKTVVSIVIGDPTMIIASFFVELLP